MEDKKYTPPKGVFGPCSRLTADEIAMVRETHQRIASARKRRAELCHLLGIDKPYFARVGSGLAGRKPRDA